MTCRPQQHKLLLDGGWGWGLCSCSCCPTGFPLAKPESQEIVKPYSILISRALKSVKKTVRENYQEHANEVKSSADTREVFMPAPRRTGIADPSTARAGGAELAGTRGSAVPLASLPSLWISQRFPWDFSLCFCVCFTGA